MRRYADYEKLILIHTNMKKILLSIAVAMVSVSLFAKVPVIGVSGFVDGAKNMVNVTYTNAVRLAGGCPFVIPVTSDEQQIEAIVSSIDALIMTGGPDFDPLLYGEEPLRANGDIVPTRDDFDIKLVRAAVAKGIPVLGICRGEQVLSVAFGGTLWQDIPSQIATSTIKHRQAGTPGSYPTHTINIEKGSFLYKALGNVETSRVNSFHHQAIKDVPAGFKVVALSKDGIIEAVERTAPLAKEYKDGGNIIIGTQFHPEILSTGSASPFVGIFRIIVEKASK